MKKSELRQIIKEEIVKIIENNINADKIIGVVNANYKEGKPTIIKYKGKTYNIIKFLSLNFKTVSFQTDRGEKSFKHKDILNLISS